MRKIGATHAAHLVGEDGAPRTRAARTSRLCAPSGMTVGPVDDGWRRVPPKAAAAYEHEVPCMRFARSLPRPPTTRPTTTELAVTSCRLLTSPSSPRPAVVMLCRGGGVPAKQGVTLSVSSTPTHGRKLPDADYTIWRVRRGDPAAWSRWRRSTHPRRPLKIPSSTGASARRAACRTALGESGPAVSFSNKYRPDADGREGCPESFLASGASPRGISRPAPGLPGAG